MNSSAQEESRGEQETVAAVLHLIEAAREGRPARMELSTHRLQRAFEHLLGFGLPDKALELANILDSDAMRFQVYVNQANLKELHALQDTIARRNTNRDAEAQFILRYTDSDGAPRDQTAMPLLSDVGKYLNIIYSDGIMISQLVGDAKSLPPKLRRIMTKLRSQASRWDWLGRQKREALALVEEDKNGRIQLIANKTGSLHEIKGFKFDLSNPNSIKRVIHIHTHPSSSTSREMLGTSTQIPFSRVDVDTLIHLGQSIKNVYGIEVPVVGYVLPESDQHNDLYFSWSPSMTEPLDNIILHP